MPLFISIRNYSVFVLTGLLLAICFHFFVAGDLLGYPYPWNTFLFEPNDRFNDWHNSVFSANTMDPYYKNGAAVSAYFPFSYIFFLSGTFFSKTGSLLVYITSALSLLTLATVVFWHQQLKPFIPNTSQSRVSLSLLLLSTWLCYPAIFALDRGNIDIHVGALCIIYVATLRTPYRLWGAIALGIAIALKGYPLAFLLLAIVDRDYLSAMLALAIATALTLFSLSYFSGGLFHNFQGFMHGLAAYRELYVVGLGSIQFSSDPYNGLRILILSFLTSDSTSIANHVLSKSYLVASLLFALFCLYYVLFIDGPRWSRVMAVCLLATLFPNVANDYKLLTLLPGLFTLIAYQHGDNHSKPAILCVALLMSPKHYLHFNGFSISGLLNPALLIFLGISIFSYTDWRRSIALFPARIGWYLSPLVSEKFIFTIINKGHHETFKRNRFNLSAL